MKKIKEVLKSVCTHNFFLPAVFLLLGGLTTPASPFIGGLFFGAMGLKTFELIYGLNKK